MSTKSKHKATRKIKPARNTKPKQPQAKQKASSQTQTPNPDCPYRPGTLYGTLFVEANKTYTAKNELIQKVAQLTGKTEKVVEFAFQVLKSPNHRSNKKRSALIAEGDKIKLIAVRK